MSSNQNGYRAPFSPHLLLRKSPVLPLRPQQGMSANGEPGDSDPGGGYRRVGWIADSSTEPIQCLDVALVTYRHSMEGPSLNADEDGRLKSSRGTEMFDENALTELGSEIDTVVEDLIERLRMETLVGEEPFTDRLIDRLEHAINQKQLTYTVSPSPSYGPSSATTTLVTSRLNPARLVARTTVAKGANSEERLSGADAIVVLESSQPYIEAHKGILFQAKIHNGKGHFTSLGTAEISGQCERMLEITLHAFAVVYSRQDVHCFPASDINKPAWKGFRASESESVGDVFRRFLSCEIGDYDLTAVDRNSFAKLVNKRRVRNGLLIKTT